MNASNFILFFKNQQNQLMAHLKQAHITWSEHKNWYTIISGGFMFKQGDLNLAKSSRMFY